MRALCRVLAVALGLGALTMAGLGEAAAAGPGGAPIAAARAAAGYLRAAQNRDGGYGPAPGQASDALFTGWAALGLASAGVAAAGLHHGGPTLLAALRRGGGRDTGSLERTILAVHAAEASPRRVGGRDLVAALRARVRRNGSFADQVNLTAFAVLALRAAGATVPAATLPWLLAQQDADGGFGFATAGGSSDPDDTGAVLEAMAGDLAAPAARARERAIAYLRRVQDRDGGFPAAPGAGSNAQSTAWAVQGLIAAGISPSGFRRPGGASPLAYLTGLTAADGRVSYARGTVQTPVWVTAEALMALEGRPLPIGPPPARRIASLPARGSSPVTAVGRDLAAVAAAAGALTALALAPLGI